MFIDLISGLLQLADDAPPDVREAERPLLGGGYAGLAFGPRGIWIQSSWNTG